MVIMKGGEDDTLHLSTGTWTTEDIEHFAELACDLCDDLARISQAVMNEPFRESLRKV